jgi:hypothetical protein
VANFFKEEIDHVGDRLEQAIEKAGHEISTQRTLTKGEIEHLIQYAAEQFGNAIDARIEKARLETSELITSKLTQFREQVGEAAAEQKRVAIQNASVAVGASILVGIVSLYYKQHFHGEVELIDVFRSVLLAMGAGYLAWMAFKFAHGYLQTTRFKRNAVVVGLKYFDVLRPKGVIGHLAIFGLIVCAWGLLNFGDKLMVLVAR